MGGQRGFGSQRGLRMDVQRELFENQPDISRMFSQDLIDAVDGRRAVGALKIGELDQGDLGIGGTLHWCAIDGDGHCLVQHRGRLFHASFQSGTNRRRVLAFAQLASHHRSQAPAAAATRIFDAAFGNMHGASAGAPFRPQQIQQSFFLLGGKAGLVQAGEFPDGFPFVGFLGEGGDRDQ